MAAKLTPELDVDDLDRSLAFYIDVIGFRVLFGRPEERFTYLDLDGIRLMLQEAVGPGKRFRVEISTDGAEQKKGRLHNEAGQSIRCLHSARSEAAE